MFGYLTGTGSLFKLGVRVQTILKITDVLLVLYEGWLLTAKELTVKSCYYQGHWASLAAHVTRV